MPAVSVTRVSDSELTATAPALTGTCDIRVTTIFGTSPVTAADQYAAPPPASTLAPTESAVGPFLTTALLPNGGPVVGGNLVTITGTGFVTGCTVSFGSTAATEVTIVSLTEITAVAPAGSGSVPVSVTNPATGLVSATSDQCTYTFGAPLVTQLQPCCGPTEYYSAKTPYPVVITGSGFGTGTPTVTFGSTAATVTGTSATTITVNMPGASSAFQSEVPVVVTANGLASGQTASCIFTFTSGL